MCRFGRALRAFVAACACVALLACGGGGGGDGGGEAGGRGAVELSPTLLSATVVQGTSATWQVSATIIDPSAFTTNNVIVFVVDPDQMLFPLIDLRSLDSTHYVATLRSSPGLTPGIHEGTLLVQVCADADCKRQVPGSPYPLKYHVEVASNATGLALTPPSLQASAQVGNSATLTAQLAYTPPFTGSLHLSLLDPAPGLMPDLGVTQIDANHVGLTMHTSPILPVGVTSGVVRLAACGDPDCRLILQGSPLAVPYSITVTANTSGLVLSPAALQANVPVGTSATLNVQLALGAPLAGTAFVSLLDATPGLTSEVGVAAIDPTHASLTLHTSASLPLGVTSGVARLAVCSDPGCSQPLPGSPLLLPYSFRITSAPLAVKPTSATSVTVHRGDTSQPLVGAAVAAPDLDWTVSTNTPWLRPGNAIGHGNGGFFVAFDATGLPVGHYEGSVTVNCSDGQSVDLGLTLDVLPAQFTLTSGLPAFNAVNGTPIAPQSLSFTLDKAFASPWTASTSTPWLTITPTSGMTPASISLQPDPARAGAASGTYPGTVVLSSGGVDDKVVDVQLTLLKPSLSTSPPVLTLGGPTGRTPSTESLLATLNTGSNAYGLTLTGLPAWLQATPVAPTVDAQGTRVDFVADFLQVAPGSISSVITLTSQVRGDTVTQPVTVNLNKDQRRVLPSTWRAGFVSVPGTSDLTTSITVTDNIAGTALGAMGFTASAGVPWLKVTPASGLLSAPAVLTITADPAALPNGVLSQGSVTLTPSVASAESARIRVALWKDNGTQPDLTPPGYVQIAVDGLRHRRLAHKGGGIIDVFNMLTGQQVGTITGLDPILGAMAVSPDGSRCFVLQPLVGTLAVIDLDRLLPVEFWPLDAVPLSNFTSLEVSRPNGVEVVFVGNGRAYTAGRSLGATNIPSGSMTALADGSQMRVLPDGSSLPIDLDIDYSAMSGGVLMVKGR